MNIELNREDLDQMPPSLATSLLIWVQYQHFKPKKSKTSNHSEQLTLRLVEPSEPKLKDLALETLPSTKTKHKHVRLSQLLDAGITKTGMTVRVRLKAELARKSGYSYVTKGLQISGKGTVLYDGKEYDKPSPLAEKINGSSVNGWEYVEVKKNGQWVCLDQLRQIWRKVS